MRELGAELRRHPRQQRAVCGWLQFSDENVVRGMVTVNISQEGARFATLRPVLPAERVLVSLQLTPTGPAVECKGRVCWVREMDNGLRHFGVRFVDLHEDESAALAQFLEEKESQSTMTAV
ncbi:MAG: PilZ domain-containing protein [Candidatus Hydrogenedentes bacterium]|nr:PilZ domain-containing protein [Candidatus Hydrogenedentota bacterium]